MAIETSDLRQKAVLWAATGFDDYGQVTVAAATEIKVRWVTGKKTDLGVQSDSVGFDSTAAVDRHIPDGSILRLGSLRDLPDVLTDLNQVIDSKTTPDIKGRNTRRTVSLMKFSDDLPTIS